jgi:hypothetical protein
MNLIKIISLAFGLLFYSQVGLWAQDESRKKSNEFVEISFLPLDASTYHNLGAGLQNSRIQFERSKQGRVAFLGGSITYNGGWRDSLMVYLQKRFPQTEFEFIAAGIPSMGSTPSAFRLFGN